MKAEEFNNARSEEDLNNIMRVNFIPYPHDTVHDMVFKIIKVYLKNNSSETSD